ncbi:GTP cyclohydrolase II [Oceanispirochaeta sp.]|uniref:GTP cyclohydrolase II n=1 Tax=Oceanispirochaeta sp. TaxID=2035350 RepID=UPI002604989A|nr:GTP cyclohydrolase II [Oceanispirochaeta sp.]MDA3956224.1 GTP cyclohydrolase II [Oceanispirochaeta sp.]
MNIKEKVTVEKAAEILASGGMIIVTDHEDRENEGDLVGAVRHAGPEMINFMASKAKGLICCALEQSIFDKAGISLLDTTGGPGAMHGTRFGTPIDAVKGCTTGISAFDRSVTLKSLVSPDCRPGDFARPGHMFPILEAEGGLALRQGHTEASVYLTRVAGLEGAAVICEMMDEDGHMVRGNRIQELAEEWGLGVLSVKDIAAHRVNGLPQAVPLPTEYGDFQMEIIQTNQEQEENFCLYKTSDSATDSQAPLVRIHSECLTGDLLGSRRCDCGAQLNESLRLIGREEGGCLIYLRQEGRGIGLTAKLEAYQLQDRGLDTLEANQHLGYPADGRDYSAAADWLKMKGMTEIRLLTNNPEKVSQLEARGIGVTRIPLVVGENPVNKRYIATKQMRMGHLGA